MNTALELRTIAGLTQDQSAKLLDVSTRTWRNWEADQPPMPLKRATAFKEAFSAPKAVTTSQTLFNALSAQRFDLPSCLRRKPATRAQDMKPLSRQTDDDPEPIVLLASDVTAADLAALKVQIQTAHEHQL